MSGAAQFIKRLNALRRAQAPSVLELGEYSQPSALESMQLGAAYRQAARSGRSAAPAFDALARETTPEAVAFANLRSPLPDNLSPLAQMALRTIRGADAERALRSGKVYDEAARLASEIYETRRIGRDAPDELMRRADDLMRSRPVVDVEPVELPRTVRLPPEHGVDADLVHFSPHLLSVTDPRRYGTGIAGEEAARIPRGSPVRDRTYFYIPEGDPRAVVPEGGLGALRHVGRGHGLYPLGGDPESLSGVAAMLHRMPYVGGKEWNKGLVDPAVITTLEEIIRQLGYSGYTSPRLAVPGAKGSAVSFEPVRMRAVE